MHKQRVLWFLDIGLDTCMQMGCSRKQDLADTRWICKVRLWCHPHLSRKSQFSWVSIPLYCLVLFLLSSDGFMFRQMNGCPIKPSHIYAHPVLIWFLTMFHLSLGAKKRGMLGVRKAHSGRVLEIGWEEKQSKVVWMRIREEELTISNDEKIRINKIATVS